MNILDSKKQNASQSTLSTTAYWIVRNNAPKGIANMRTSGYSCHCVLHHAQCVATTCSQFPTFQQRILHELTNIRKKRCDGQTFLNAEITNKYHAMEDFYQGRQKKETKFKRFF